MTDWTLVTVSPGEDGEITAKLHTMKGETIVVVSAGGLHLHLSPDQAIDLRRALVALEDARAGANDLPSPEEIAVGEAQAAFDEGLVA